MPENIKKVLHCVINYKKMLSKENIHHRKEIVDMTNSVRKFVYEIDSGVRFL